MADSLLGTLETVAELEGKDGIKTRQLDVTDEAAINKLAAEVGAVDVLFNCAGIVHHGSILDATSKDWEQAFAVNANAPTSAVSSTTRLRRADRDSTVATIPR